LGAGGDRGDLLLLGLLAAFLLSKPMGVYALGEGYAKSMGINVKLFRALIILLSSVLSACVTAFAGPISFVGIAVPHITRSLLKTARPQYMIPAVFLCGAVFCIFCDLLARTVLAPTRAEDRHGHRRVRRARRHLHDGQSAEDAGGLRWRHIST
jgi:ABC-type Fe3+-siderophore transport system permease subunit